MVDNRGISPIATSQFRADNSSANKMSEEKYGQGGEYFAQEMEEEQEQPQTQIFQDRSAQLRASLNGLAMANAGSMMFMKALKEKEQSKLEKSKNKTQKQNQEKEDEKELFYED